MADLEEDSLQYLCVKAIVDDFDRFCVIYNTPACIYPKRYYEYIQKMYTHEILQLLLESDTLKNEHLPFVINKYIGDLDLYHFPETCDLEVIKDRLVEVGKYLKEFAISGESNFAALHIILHNLSAIEVLELEYTNCSDNTLKIIVENCPFIRTLNVYCCQDVTDEGMKIICSEAHKIALENLDVDRTSVSDAGIAHVLQHMPSLMTLTYDTLSRAICLTANEKMKDNDRVYNLRSLAMCDPKFSLKQCALLCPLVKDLAMNHLDSQEQVDICKAFKDLEDLTMECDDTASDLIINNLLVESGSKIHSLRLINFTMNIDVVALNCPKLRCLRLDNPIFLNISKANNTATTFPTLKAFHLESSALGHDPMATKSTGFIINSSPNLEMLTIKFSELSAEIKEAILQCKWQLKKMNFSNSTPMDIEFLQEILLRHPSLHKLVIENCGIIGTQYDDLMQFAESIDSEVDIIWDDCSADLRAFALNYPLFRDGERLQITHLYEADLE